MYRDGELSQGIQLTIPGWGTQRQLRQTPVMQYYDFTLLKTNKLIFHYVKELKLWLKNLNVMLLLLLLNEYLYSTQQ